MQKECCFAKLATAAFFAPIKELSMKQSMSFGIWPEVVCAKTIQKIWINNSYSHVMVATKLLRVKFLNAISKVVNVCHELLHTIKVLCITSSAPDVIETNKVINIKTCARINLQHL